jgi:uncharacterized protein YndB with AHSA1/START domain
VTATSIVIAAAPGAVYELVADPMRMPEWSPECIGCRWVGGATGVAVGARFRGTSRNGRRRWSTTSTIVDVRPNERFAWDVTYLGLPVARWAYQIAPHPDGVELVESVEDRRGFVLRTLSPYITGSRDRASRNAETMASTLQAVKAAAESHC